MTDYKTPVPAKPGERDLDRRGGYDGGPAMRIDERHEKQPVPRTEEELWHPPQGENTITPAVGEGF